MTYYERCFLRPLPPWWRWLVVGEMTQAGDIVDHGGVVGCIELGSATPVTEKFAPTRRRFSMEDATRVEMRRTGSRLLLAEEDRQMVLLSLALNSLVNPGFESACRAIAKTFFGEQMFDDFRKYNADRFERVDLHHGVKAMRDSSDRSSLLADD